MISPWEIYLVLQLDTIGTTLGVTSALLGVSALVAGLWGGFEKSMSNSFPELEMSKRERANGDRLHGWAKRLAIFAVPILALNALLPSSKTAAAMIIIPAIANNETIQKEAADLYGLAKEALTEAIKPDAEPKK